MQSMNGVESAKTAINRSTLVQLVLKLLQRKGMFAAEAEMAALRMIEASETGSKAGLESLSQILEAMDLGEIDPRARIISISETPAVALLDGSTGLGHVAATRAMLMAIEKAREIGTGTVVVKNSRYAGDLGVIAKLAADVGMIGFVTSSFMTSEPELVGGHEMAWCVRKSEKTSSVIIRENSSRLSSGASLMMALFAAGLAGADSMNRKRKSSTVANAVEHYVQAINPDKFGTVAAIEAKWQEAFDSQNDQSFLIDSQNPSAVVHLKTELSEQLAELAAKIKFEVTW